MKCSTCGISNPESVRYCVGCGTRLLVQTQSQAGEQDSPSSTLESTQTFPGEQAAGLLKLVAWLDLLSGFVVALVIWSNTNPLSPGYGVFSGLAWFLQGIFVCAFLLVVASIAENLIAIRRALETNH
jgi:hypothetical protein